MKMLNKNNNNNKRNEVFGVIRMEIKRVSGEFDIGELGAAVQEDGEVFWRVSNGSDSLGVWILEDGMSA
jgi:hypothetical protein